MKSSVVEPCENPSFNFPPLPRRPIYSQTYRTFVQILSHCATLQSLQLPPKHGGTMDAAEVVGDGKEREVNGANPVDLDVNGANPVGVCPIVGGKNNSCTAVGHEVIIDEKLDKLPILNDYEILDDFCIDTNDTSLKDNRDMTMELEEELRELICSSTAMQSSDCPMNLSVAADDIEEGEVSGDDIPYETMDFLFDSAEAQEGLGSENQSGAIENSENDMASFFSLEEVPNSNNILETQSFVTHFDSNNKVNEVNKADYATEIGQILENVAEVKSNHTAVAEDIQHRTIISKNTTEDNDVLTDEKDVCVAKNEKIKKRGPLSKERKAKKKRKERIKRAENNRKLGVKRVKLQPVVKQKKVTYCRHYMKGRCQEGEKCKFSHDATPLTKSTPCCHFARHSCMKGDDCPYDHQLSKYPCNNYVTNGFCHRGAECMFSHEISVTGGSLTSSSNNCKADLKSPVQISDLNPKNQMNLHGRTPQQFDSNPKSLEKPTIRSSEKIPVLYPQKPAAVPKGITMISSSSSKHDKSAICVEENVVSLNQQQQATINSLQRVQKSNDVSKKVPMRPKGINFLSFCKTTQVDGLHVVGESLIGGSNRSNRFEFPSSGNKTADNSNQSSLNVVTGKNGTENLVSDTRVLQGLKFLSFGKKSEDNISAVVGVDNALPCTQGRENSFGGPKPSIDMPRGPSCSSNPFSLCSDNSARTSFPVNESLSSNVPKSALKALNSTLAFAAKIDSKIKLSPCISNVSSKVAVQDGTNFANTKQSFVKKDTKQLFVAHHHGD